MLHFHKVFGKVHFNKLPKFLSSKSNESFHLCDLYIIFFYIMYNPDVVHRMNEGYRAWGALKVS